MLELNGHKYSREQFEEYTHRAKFRLNRGEDWRNDITIDVYTTNSNKEDVFYIVNARTKEEVTACKMEHWTTKEQDDLSAKLIEETLKDF